VRFDLNDYSVPHTHVRRTLAVLADEHGCASWTAPPSWPRHRAAGTAASRSRSRPTCSALVEHKRAARAHRGCDRLAQAAPAAPTLLERAAARGDNLGSITAALLRLLDRWRASRAAGGHPEALQRDVPHPNAVRLALERAREASGQPPPVALVLPEHVARRDAPVRPHALGSYDRHPDQRPTSDPDPKPTGEAR
jgi:hypothetical protein